MPAKTLADFTAELRNRNISRPNLYYVEIVAPVKMASPSSSDASLVSMWCHTAQTPQSTILTQENHVEAGTRRKYAYDQDYNNLTLNFYVDQEYKIKKFFDYWKTMIVRQKRNFGFAGDYTAEALNLYIINQAGEATYKYEYSRIYPKSISAIDLSYADGNSVSTFSVDFVFEDVFSSRYSNGVQVSTTKPSGMTFTEDKNGKLLTNREVLIASIPQ